MRDRYLVVYRPTATGYAASIPELPGCVAAGGSLGATRELMRTALQWHLEDMRATGQDIPATDPAEVAEYLEVDAASPASVSVS